MTPAPAADPFAPAAPERDPRFREAVAMVAGAGACLAAAAAGLAGARAAAGAAAGAVVAIVNLWVIGRIVHAAIASRAGAAWTVLGGLKIAVLVAGAGLLVRAGGVGAPFLALGYAALPVGIALLPLVPLPRRA